MGCGCKKEIKKDPKTGEIIKEKSHKELLVARIMLYLIIIVLSPLIMLGMLVILFNYFFITGKIDLIKTGVGINNALSKKEKEEEPSDDEEYEYDNIYVVEKID